jgi:hypothetical protein
MQHGAEKQLFGPELLACGCWGVVVKHWSPMLHGEAPGRLAALSGQQGCGNNVIVMYFVKESGLDPLLCHAHPAPDIPRTGLRGGVSIEMLISYLTEQPKAQQLFLVALICY